MQAAQTITMPERRCILTGETKDAGDLIRFVLSPGDEIVPDIAARLPGRGLWVSANKKQLCAALGNTSFAKAAARALKRPVSAAAIPADLADRVDHLLRARCLNLLGLERKKGTLVMGFGGTMDAIRNRKAAFIVQAADAAGGGREKLQALLNHMPVPARVFTIFSREELGLALGRDYVVHAAVKAGGSAVHLLKELTRLERYLSRPEIEG